MDEALPQGRTNAEPDDRAALPVRVGWVAGTQADGPLARVYQPLAIGLMDELVDVILFHPRSGGAELGASLPETHPFAMPGLLGPGRSTVREMAEEVRRGKIKLLHALDLSVVRLTGKVAKAAGIRFVVSSDAVGDARRIRTLPSHAAAVMAASTPISKAIADHHLIEAEKISVVRPGVYCVRQPTCFDGSARSIAIVAGGDRQQSRQFEAILLSLAELKGRKLDCVFFVICAGAMEVEIRRAAARLGLTDSITFVDPRPHAQFAGIIKAADIYVSAGPPKHLDLNVLLAMSAGSVVLCPDDPSADFLIDGQTALLYEGGCGEELTTRLVSLLDDPQAGRSLAQCALSYVSEHHSPARAVAQTAAVYRRALAN